MTPLPPGQAGKAPVGDDPEALFAHGLDCLQAGDSAAAREAFAAARTMAPEVPEIHANLALAQEDCGQYEAALDSCRVALTLAPGNTQILLNLSALLCRCQRLAEAEAVCLQALESAPDHPGAWSSLGVLHASQQHEVRAEACYRQALEIDPAHRNAQFNLAYLLLRQARYEEGWQCLEARTSQSWMQRELALPCWRGESLAGRGILVGCEAGYGDMLHFCRYAPMLKAAGASRVGILAYPGLERLFATLPGVDRVLPLGTPLQPGDWDCWIAPLSLPQRFASRAETLPASLPYLQVPAAARERWQARLTDRGKLRVGLVWQGNPAFANDRQRSLPTPALLAPLLAYPDIEFLALHKDGASALPGVHELGSDIDDFADTAAILQQLDLLIGVDTAVIHLAGALARPCWLLLADYLPDWRWLKRRNDSPWYPGVMRIFRQPRAGDWPALIAQVAAELGHWIDTRPAGRTP